MAHLQVILQERAEQRIKHLQTAGGFPGDHGSWLLRKSDIELTTQELGRGGWGTVRVATFQGLQVAAKILHSVVISSDNREQVLREMSIMARVRHPNLVLFIGATDEGESIIVMEVMSTTLRATLDQRPLNPPQMTAVSLDVARALNYLHQMRPDPIIHRNLSSSNVLLNPGPNDTWMAKVSDYGLGNLSKLASSTAPRNPAYAAPESGDPSRQSPKMDVYSYGVLLLEICTRRLPDPKDRDALIKTVRHQRMAALIPQCLQRDPQNRPTVRTILNR